ncbi:MAG: putative membrane protein [Arenicella sp.]|jgi:putative membrane protein
MAKTISYFGIILIVFHAVGIGLFLYLDTAPELSYLTILGSALMVLIAEQNRRKSLLIFLVIFIVGYVIELIGVQTGYLFGQYEYETAMGPLLKGTPIFMGATWYATVSGAANISRFVKSPMYSQAILAGLLTVLMDVLIEQVAVSYGLWQWVGGEIPLYNYVCWFVFGTLFAFIYLKFTENKNKVAFQLFWIWIAFFSILTFAI